MTYAVVSQERGTLKRFAEACGDRPIDRYERADLTKFLRLMRQLPAKYGKSPKDKKLSLEALIARAEAADPPVDRLTDKTANDT